MELEESINIYERGEALKDHCDRLLKQAEAKVEKLTFGQDGRADRHRAASSRRTDGVSRTRQIRSLENPLDCIAHGVKAGSGMMAS